MDSMNFGYHVFSSHVIVWGLLILSESQLPTDMDRVSLALVILNNRLHCLRSEPLRGRPLAMYSTRVHSNLLLSANVQANPTERSLPCPPKKAILEAGQQHPCLYK